MNNSATIDAAVQQILEIMLSVAEHTSRGQVINFEQHERDLSTALRMFADAIILQTKDDIGSEL